MTYLGLALVFLAVAVVVALVAAVRRPDAQRTAAIAVTAGVLVALTIVFDSVMVAADLFRYDAEQLVGAYVWRAPVEDLAWPVAAALLLPSVWALLAPARADAPRADAPEPDVPVEPHARVDAHPIRAGIVQVVGSSRPLSWINTAYPFAAAYLLAGGRDTLTLVVGTLYFLIPYNLLMYGINDVFDYESDLRNPRKGGVEGVVLSDRWHRTTIWAAAASNVPFLVALVWLGTGWSDLVLAVSVLAVIAYSAPRLRFKERPVLDSFTSSTHFVSPAVFGVTLAGGSFTRPVVAVLAAYFLWGAASQAFGAVQDIRADREAGIGSVATAFGARRTVRLAMAGYGAAAVLMLDAGWPGLLAALVPVVYLLSVAPFRNLSDEDCEQANRGWRRFLWLNLVMGFLVTQLLIVMALTS